MKIRQVWVCKHDCGHRYESPLVLAAEAHNCKKKKGRNIDSIIEVLSDSPCYEEEEALASQSTATDAPTSQEGSDMATKRAAPTAAAKSKTKATTKATTNDEKATRRSFGERGWLAVEVDKLLRKTPDGPVTVGAIVKAVKNSEGENPSTGAVAACITRWGEAGYVKVKDARPMSFNGYTAKWKGKTLDDFLAAEKAKRAKARAAAKAAA